MKISILTILFALTVTIGSLAASYPLDLTSCFPNACGEKGRYCKTPSLEIWTKFCDSTSVADMPLSGVYSGTCFHEADNRDPFYPHHGVVLIDKVDGKRHFGGEFSFYAKENPYKYLDVEAARARMPWFLSGDHEIKWHKDYARILLNSEMEFYEHVHYYIKTNRQDDDTLLLIGFWRGAAYRVFCELTINE